MRSEHTSRLRLLDDYLRRSGLIEAVRPEFSSKIERLVAQAVKAYSRPQWKDRQSYGALKDLNAFEFLRTVYADKLAANELTKVELRAADPELMALIESYISHRRRDNRGPGLSKGISFVTVCRDTNTKTTTKKIVINSRRLDRA